MMKKIILIIVFSCLLISCGKKGDPKYNDPKKKAKIYVIYSNKV